MEVQRGPNGAATSGGNFGCHGKEGKVMTADIGGEEPWKAMAISTRDITLSKLRD